MKNIKLSTRFSIIFIIVGLIPLIFLNTMDILTAKEMMGRLQRNDLKQKMEGDVQSANIYIHDAVGKLQLSDGKLCGEDNQRISEQNELIDKISNDLGVVATVFVKDEKGYCRVLTSIIDKRSNERIVGTYLDDQSKAFETIEKGEEYIGKADIEGEEYTTAYQPIKDQSGNNIGIVFVGISLDNSNQILHQEIGNTTRRSVIVLIFLAILGLSSMYRATKSITRPILKIVDEAHRIAELNLTQDVAAELIHRGDEIGMIAQSMESIQESLRSVITSSSQISSNVSATSEELANTCSEASQATEEMAKTVQEIAQGATDQAQNTASCMQQLENLNSMMDGEQENVGSLREASQKVSALAEEGMKVLKHLVNKINISNEATIKVYDNMQETNESAKRISEASNVIASIADQTNLLALNASIEAARAGEHGKGFSVVAEEIRKLAEQSAASTKMIDEQILALQRDVQSAVEVTEKVKDMLSEQTGDVKITENKYLDITDAINMMQKVVIELTQCGKQMMTEKDEVSSNIESLSAVAEENAAGTEEASACIEEQSAALHSMHTSSTTLAEMALELQKGLEKFKL